MVPLGGVVMSGVWVVAGSHQQCNVSQDNNHTSAADTKHAGPFYRSEHE